MNRAALERFQLPLYAAALAAGLAVGTVLPGAAGAASAALWPLLGLLLFVTFTQIPLGGLAAAVRDRRFLLALAIGNAVVLPLVVAAAAALRRRGGGDPLCRGAGAACPLHRLVRHLRRPRRGGDGPRAVAATPLLLMGQMLLLPPALWWLAGAEAAALVRAEAFLAVFAGLILLPLAAAFLLEQAAGRSPRRRRGC